MTVEVTIDEFRCQGHTMCHLVAPEVFKLRDCDGHSFVETSRVSGRLEELALKAAAGCPEQAITVIPLPHR